MPRLALAASFVAGLAAVLAAVALAAGDDPPLAGPVTGVDQLRGVSFTTRCTFSYRLPDDPILFPGRPGASHDHTFFGARSTSATSTDATLRAGGSTCSRRGETAAYWTPTLFSGSQPIVPVVAWAYYRRGTLARVTAFPPGFRLIAGSAMATAAQPLRVTWWDCGIEAGVAASSEPPACPPGPRTALRLHVAFPECWDGQSLDSPDHRSHMAYDVVGVCPPSHPVALPEIELILRYPELTGPVTLASGGAHSAHADFVNAWDQQRLDGLVEDCLNAMRFCGTGA